MKKLILGTAILAVAGGMSTSANATLASNAALLMGPQTGFCDYDLGTYPDSCTVAAIPDGNYFAMDNDGSGSWENSERVGIEVGADGGILLGVSQTGTTETFGGIGSIDKTWNFFGNPGNHTQAGTLSVIAGTNTIDMTGWTVLWGDPANGGIDPVTGDPTRGPIDMGAGAAAIVTCDTVNCAVGESFTLDYSAVVPSGGFSGVAYQLHLSGTIGTAPPAVPVPAAVWLFGSGLLGLVGVARRRKAA